MPVWLPLAVSVASLLGRAQVPQLVGRRTDKRSDLLGEKPSARRRKMATVGVFLRLVVRPDLDGLQPLRLEDFDVFCQSGVIASAVVASDLRDAKGAES